MGKAEDDRNLPSGVSGAVGEDVGRVSERNARRGWISRLVGFKCLFLLILSVALFLSAMFWLPPFRYDTDPKDPDLDPRFRDHEIVASFSVKKLASFLNENRLQLQNDIFQEISYDSIKVAILSIEPLAGSNTTKVVFGVDRDVKHREISPLSLSSIRESFESLLINQSALRLTKSLFGEPFLFEVLKFPGGITVIPTQQVFVLQKVQILFNFTLNFSIYEIQINFNALTSQLKKGLNLAPYESLFVSLSNSAGSTVSPPTVVHSLVLLRVGNSRPRAKQLADTITGSRSKNLGLNNTIFGKVKQVRLSSILPNRSDSWTNSPAPSPLPHGHHHHHHHHHLIPYMAPAVSPVPAAKRGSHMPEASSPSPQRNPTKSPSALPPCPFENRRRQRGNTRGRHSHLAPGPAPSLSPQHSAQPPHQQLHPPASNSAESHLVPSSAPLPHVVFAHGQPPHKSQSNDQHSDGVAPISPSPSLSNAGSSTVEWTILLVLLAAGLCA